MRNFSKKIITSVLTLVLTVVALGTGVFAWFSMNTKTDATGLTGSAQAASGGFYISHSGLLGSWKNVLELDDVLVDGGFLNGPGTFTDLTTANGVDIKKIAFDGVNTLGANATEGYVEFDLYFITGNIDRFIHIIKLDIITNVETFWSAEKAVTQGDRIVSPGDLMQAELGHALRVSFQKREWDKSNASAVDATTATIFENTESATADDNFGGATKVFGNTLGFGQDGSNEPVNNFAAMYYNAVNGEDLKSVAPILAQGRSDIQILAGGIVNAPIIETTALDTPGDVQDIDVSFSYGARITVRVWLEGWDQEAFNALFNSTATINMTFEIRNA